MNSVLPSGALRAAVAGDAFDVHAAVELLAQRRRDQVCDIVRRAAGGKSHNKA